MQVIAGAAVISMMLAVLAVPAQIYGSAPQGTSAAAKTEDGKENSSFEEAVEAFYQNSGSITDEQILASARDIVSDTDALESALKADERESAARALSGFEEAKASYLTSVINKADTADDTAAAAVSNQDAVCREWDRQGEYAQLMISEGAVIREMIPRYQVVSCTKKDDTIKLDVDEWMTQGYSSSVESESVNASAYSYMDACRDQRDRRQFPLAWRRRRLCDGIAGISAFSVRGEVGHGVRPGRLCADQRYRNRERRSDKAGRRHGSFLRNR